jgi:multidrug efflux pump subunit AcrB
VSDGFLFCPADYIKTSVSNLSSHLLLGGLFVVIILYLFLYNLRTAFISAIAIPLCSGVVASPVT